MAGVVGTAAGGPDPTGQSFILPLGQRRRAASGADVAAALAPAHVEVASDDAGPAHGSAKGLLDLDLPRKHAAGRAREDQLGR